MHTLAWLRKESAGAKLKKEWSKDVPLAMSEGGTVESMSETRMKSAEETLRNGGTVTGLVCLTSISNTYSVSGIRFQEQRMEAAGRQFWSTNKGPSANQPPPAAGMPADEFWSENDPLFPASWPAKLTLPVVVRDPTTTPKEWQLLAMDESVVAFWKIVDFAHRRLDAMTKRKAEANVPAEEAKALEAKVALYAEQLQRARKLHRNVVISVEYLEANRDSEDRALSLREENESLREHCGLSGWNKIAVIGNRRDKMKRAGLECGPDEVAADLAKVKWGPGRVVTAPVVEKALTIWNRAPAEVVDAILSAQSNFGRDSPWEEYTKLIICFQTCKTNQDLLWAVETINSEKANGKRTGNHSNAELQKKSSIINVCLLRKKAISGIISSFVQPAIEIVESLVAMHPGLSNELAALKRIKTRYSSVHTFWAALATEARAAGTAAPDTLMQNLPKWCSLRCQRMLRQIMEGKKDGPLVGLCASPPKGGVGAIRYDPEIVQAKGYQEDIAEMSKDYEKWSEGRQGKAAPAGSEKNPAKTDATTQDGGKTQQDGSQPPELSDEVVKIREELVAASKEVRTAHASLQVMPSTNLAICHAITGAAAYKQASNDSTVHRCALVYLVPCSWDPSRPAEGKQDRRSNLPMALWAEDLDSFVTAANTLVTAENENYAVVFAGRTKRGSAGMASEAGLAIESQIIEAFKKSEQNQAQTWRLKRFTEIMTTQKGRSRGLIGASGSRMEVVIFFYRGVWPSKMKASLRTLIPGSTSDDIWLNIPDADFQAVPKMPYVVKKSILSDTAWSAVSVATLPPEPEPEGKQNSDEEETKGSKRKASGDSKKASKDTSGGKTPKKQKDGKEDKKEDKKENKKEDKKDNKGKKDATGKAKAKGKAEPKKEAKPKKKKDSKKAGQKSGIGVRSAELPLPSYGMDETLADTEYFCHHDVSLVALRQSFREWEARAVVVWTLGNGSAVLAAVLDELPVLGFALDSAHLTYAMYAIDVQIARRFQIRIEDNKLFDADFSKRIQKAMDGKESDADSDAPAKSKKKNKDKGGKQEKKNKKDKKDSTDDEEEEEEESSSSSSSSSDS